MDIFQSKSKRNALRSPSILSRRASRESHKSSRSTPSITIRSTTPPPDPTPTEKHDIEGALNFHLGQLDAMEARIKWLNEQMDRDSVVLVRLQMDKNTAREAKVMEERVQALFECKRQMGGNVAWHRERCHMLAGMLKEVPESQVSPSRGRVMGLLRNVH